MTEQPGVLINPNLTSGTVQGDFVEIGGQDTAVPVPIPEYLEFFEGGPQGPPGSGGVTTFRTVPSGTYTIQPTDEYIFAPVGVTLVFPDPSTMPGSRVGIKCTTQTVGSGQIILTVPSPGIDFGSLTQVTPLEYWAVMSDGVNWWSVD